jgi:hypothetical protein
VSYDDDDFYDDGSGYRVDPDEQATRDEEDRADLYLCEDCGCGHRRKSHGANGCGVPVTRQDRSGLPDPIWPRDADGEPIPWECAPRPTNWPPESEIPMVTQPCGCAQFHYPEPPDPDY